MAAVLVEEGKLALSEEPVAMCQKACPSRTNVPEYIRLISEGDLYGAWKINRQANVFPSVCGRVCVRPCEAACKRQHVLTERKSPCESVAIRALKRFAADYLLSSANKKKFLDEVLPTIIKNNKRVAIIGAGPAGLTVANDLVLAGCDVTVYEEAPVAGGMLILGIPSYRLPRYVIEEEIKLLMDLGVKINLNTPVGRKDSILLSDVINEYDAVFMGAGAHLSKKLGIKSEELPGVTHAITFLRRVNLGEEVDIVGKRIAVIGGGFSAADAARAAIRLGAKEVYILYRRGSEEMPMDQEEHEETVKEGVKIQYLTSPVQVIGNTYVTGLRCVKNKLGGMDASRRREPVPIPGSEFEIPLDMVIAAIGQGPDKSLLPEGMVVHPEALRTNHEKVFIGGDFIRGTRNIIEVIAEGHEAANAIYKHLFEKELSQYQNEEKVLDTSPWLTQNPETIERQKTPKLHEKSFEEVERTFDKDSARIESTRCMQCNYIRSVIEDTCVYCGKCVECCPYGSIEVQTRTNPSRKEENWFLGGRWHAEGHIKLVTNTDSCIQCGICAQGCPTKSIRFVSKGLKNGRHV